MRLKFLDRENETSRLTRAFASTEGTLCAVYGRRRCGKSRLLQESLPQDRSIYFVADEREPNLQRSALALTIAEHLQGFDHVQYPDWNSLFERFWKESPSGWVLALDEFPYLVKLSPELPSILQRLADLNKSKPVHVVIAGSSQRMMMGLVLDASAPLYGRAREIIPIGPLGAGLIAQAFKLSQPKDMLDAFSFWGGIPRYWELALDYGGGWEAARRLVLDPLGVLHHEPKRLLLDDLRETAQAASILALIGQGCHRISEIAARLGKPTTSLTRPFQRLLELGLIRRELPFGASPRNSKKVLYKLNDPFLAFWFRYVEPNRSRLEAGAIASVLKEVKSNFSLYRGEIWEGLVREAVARIEIEGTRWNPGYRWWGAGSDKKPLEVDIMAESVNRSHLLVCEVKSTIPSKGLKRIERDLDHKVQKLPMASAYKRVVQKIVVAGAVNLQSSSVISGELIFDALK